MDNEKQAANLCKIVQLGCQLQTVLQLVQVLQLGCQLQGVFVQASRAADVALFFCLDLTNPTLEFSIIFPMFIPGD
jgi:hypothetical protein